MLRLLARRAAVEASAALRSESRRTAADYAEDRREGAGGGGRPISGAECL